MKLPFLTTKYSWATLLSFLAVLVAAHFLGYGVEPAMILDALDGEITLPTPTPVAFDEQGLTTGIVERVVDGDTIKLVSGETVRYIGIDTPETKHPTKGVECFGKKASEKNKELVEGKEVQLEKDVSDTDRYGRMLAYVYVDGVMVNEYLVAEGYANALSYPPDVKYQKRIQEAESRARELHKGLWGECE